MKKHQAVIDQFRSAATATEATAIAQAAGLRCDIVPPKVNGGGYDSARLCGHLKARNGVLLCQSSAWKRAISA